MRIVVTDEERAVIERVLKRAALVPEVIDLFREEAEACSCGLITMRRRGDLYFPRLMPQYCQRCGDMIDVDEDGKRWFIRRERIIAALTAYYETLELIGNNDGRDPVWWARYALKRWHFADAINAPEWFKKAAREAEAGQ